MQLNAKITTGEAEWKDPKEKGLGHVQEKSSKSTVVHPKSSQSRQIKNKYADQTCP